MALRYIQQGAEKTVFPRIFGVMKAKNASEILKQDQGTEKTIAWKFQSLWRDFDDLKMEERESVQDFSSRVSKMTVYELTGSLLAHEQMINRSAIQSTEQAFQSKHISKSDSNHKKGKYGKLRHDNEKKSNWKGKTSKESCKSESCIIYKKTKS